MGMVFVSTVPTCISDSCTPGKVQLLALSLSGQLQWITLPVKSADASLCMEPSGQVGRSVRDLLSAIGDVCERYTHPCFHC